MKTFVRYGNEKYFFNPPSDWNVLTSAEFQDHTLDKDAEQLTENALEKPTGSKLLGDRISPDEKVAIIIEDITRASPKKKVLKVLLNYLNKISIPKENISVVISLGTHRELTREELKSVYGEEAVHNYRFINHDCQAADLVEIGRLETGTPVKINKTVHDAQFKIGVGSIFPHPLNGFGGGSKILFPGVADFDSILEHHLKYSFRVGSELGQTNRNPFYDEVCRLANAGGLDFIINSVLDHNDLLYDVVCGDPVKTHMAGIDICREIISRPFQQKADITVISAFPYSEGPQIMKPLAPASMITRKGGVIILAAHMKSPLPELVITGCEGFRSRHEGRIKDCLFESFDQNKRIIEESAPELNMCMSQALLALNDYRVIIFSKDIENKEADRLGFIPAEDMDQACAIADGLASNDLVSNPDVHVVPAGGVILPILNKS